MKRIPEWIIAHDGTRQPMGFECERCRMRQKLELPVSVDYFVDLSVAFAKEHSRCTAKPLAADEEGKG